jgi:hypothetical protein
VLPRRSTLRRVVLLVIAVSVLAPSSARAAGTVRLVVPDEYRCAQSGVIDFEGFRDGSDLSAASFPGVEFTTTNGFTWRVGDFATGNYNGKYPNGGYTSGGTRWAWLGESQGAGRIDLTIGNAQDFSVLVSANTGVYLEAYDDAGRLLERAGPSPATYNTDKMAELRIVRQAADIGYVLVHDTGNFFLVDGICSDARGVGDRDGDGDGIADDWERNGADTNGDGTVDLDLPAMGADPNRKDLFVEIDWLTKDARKVGPFSMGGGFEARPSLAAVTRAARSFNGWPVPNVNGAAQGIHLHIDAGPDSLMNVNTGATWDSRSRANAIRNGLRHPDWGGWSQLDAFRADHVASARRGIFHYVLYVDEIECSASGNCVTGRSRGIPGHDLVLAKGKSGVETDIQEAVTLAHELGHNLGLGHGGRERTDDPVSQHVNNKANYLSIMNYYFSNAGLQSNSGNDGILTLSPQEHATLSTSNLDEQGGLAPDPFAHLRTNFKCANSGKDFARAPVKFGDGWGGIDWNCDGKLQNGSSNSFLQVPGCVDFGPGDCRSPDASRVYGSEDYHHLRFWGVGQGWDARNLSMQSFDQPGTDEVPIEQAKTDGVWWPTRSLVTPGTVEVTVHPGSGVVDVPISLENPGQTGFEVTPRLAVAPAGLALADGGTLSLAPGAKHTLTVRVDTAASAAGTDLEGEVDFVDPAGEVLGSAHVTVHVAPGATCDEARAARADAAVPAEQVPALDALIARCSTPAPAPAPRTGTVAGCQEPKTSRTVAVRLRGQARKSGVAKPSLRIAKRIGSSKRATYRVKLTRACVTVATGTVKGTALKLTVRSNGTKKVRRGGRRVTVRTYPRLKGTYVLQASGAKNRISPVRVKFG